MRYNLVLSFLAMALVTLGAGCADEGESGSTTVACGQHGAEHDGHCHCDPGYLFSEETCVAPAEVTVVCEEHTGEEGDVTTPADVSAEEEHHHDDACLCLVGAECPCEHGTVETYGTSTYCVPELHAED